MELEYRPERTVDVAAIGQFRPVTSGCFADSCKACHRCDRIDSGYRTGSGTRD